jgi:chitinase
MHPLTRHRSSAPVLSGIALTSVFLAACSGGGDGPTDPPANKPPTVAFTAPLAGSSFVSISSIQVAVTASDEDGSVVRVEFFLDYENGDEPYSSDTNAPYTFQVSPGLAAGSHNFRAVATDDKGATAEARMTVTITAPPVEVNPIPTVAIASPGDGTSHKQGTPIAVVVNASDTDGIAAVRLYVDGTTTGIPVQTDTTAPYAFSISTASLGFGAHEILVVAEDTRGATSNTSIDVTITP